MTELKRCPCGKIPTKLHVVSRDIGPSPEFALVQGDCCGTWKILFRNGWMHLDSLAATERARNAWNQATRG